MDERRKVLDYLWKKGIVATPDEVDEIMRNGGINFLIEGMNRREEVKRFEIIKSREYFEGTTGKSESFRRLFQDRFVKIKKILQSRVSVSSPVDIEFAKMHEGETTVVAMVRDVRTSRYGYVLEIEDLTGSVIAYADQAIGETLLPDDIIGVRGNFKNGKLYVKEVTYPGVDNAQKKEKIIDSESAIAFISDTHVGSRMFLQEHFMRFLEWLKNSESGRKVRYLIINGDLVDGIGIYPGQEKDLEMDDIYEQYSKLADLLNLLNNEINIFLIPGNHDLVRIAEPQPVLPREIRSMFNDNVRFLSNPSYISIEGMKILLYHGMSLNDLMDLIRGMKYDNVLKMMEELLKRRHLAPFYGRNVPIAPTPEDFMVIEEVPDIFVTGHIHVHRTGIYHGVLLLNASTWQKQTDYQRMHNFVPDPCKVTIKFLNKPGFSVLDFK